MPSSSEPDADRPPKILVVGTFTWDLFEPIFCRGLRRAGADVVELNVSKLLWSGRLSRRLSEMWNFGLGVHRVRRALVAATAEHRPDCVLLWRSPWASPRTIERCRGAGARRIALYNNDDPFGPDRNRPSWRAFRRSVPFADICFAYRPVNVEDLRAAGAQRAQLLRPGFDAELHFRYEPTADERARFECDLVFVGHHEADERLGHLAAAVDAGLFVRLFGAGWDGVLAGTSLEHLAPVRALHGRDYMAAIASARVAAVFLSKRNRDEYTQRCFEIPAIGTPMLAPRTPSLCAMYEEGRDAIFYSTQAEFVENAIRLAGDEGLRRTVADAAHDRIFRSRYGIEHRAAEFLEAVLSL